MEVASGALRHLEVCGDVYLTLHNGKFVARAKALVCWRTAGGATLRVHESPETLRNLSSDMRILVGREVRRPNGRWIVVAHRDAREATFFFGSPREVAWCSMEARDGARLDVRCSQAHLAADLSVTLGQHCRMRSVPLSFGALDMTLRDHANFDVGGAAPCVADALKVRAHNDGSVKGVVCSGSLNVELSLHSTAYIHRYPGCQVTQDVDQHSTLEFCTIDRDFMPLVQQQQQQQQQRERLLRFHPWGRRRHVRTVVADPVERLHQTVDELTQLRNTLDRGILARQQQQTASQLSTLQSAVTSHAEEMRAAFGDWGDFLAEEYQPDPRIGASDWTDAVQHAPLRGVPRHARQRRGAEPSGGTFFSPEVDAKEPDAPDDTPNSKLCVVCLGRQKRCVVSPCGHKVLCIRCSAVYAGRSVAERICPVCKTSMLGITKVYE